MPAGEVFFEDGVYDYNMLANGEVLFEVGVISDFGDIRYIEATYGSNITYVGFPLVSGSGAVMYTNVSFGVSTFCEYPEAAWELIELMLSSKYQDSFYYLPVIQSSLEDKAEAALAKDYVEEYMYINDEIARIIGQTTEQDIELVMEIIDGMSVKRAYSHTEIADICVEEAEYYFNGRKSLDEVVSLIQNRVQTYLYEIGE